MMNVKTTFVFLLFLTVLFAASCEFAGPAVAQITGITRVDSDAVERPALSKISKPEIRSILESANSQTKTVTGYTQKYYSIAYPNGDVPSNTGACTDVVIRSYRAAGIDLQKEVHEDMKAHFSEYPQRWGLRGPDSNIDHRRVPNLHAYFTRKGKSLPITTLGLNFEPGDIVAWDLNGKGMTHIGVVSNMWNESKKRYLIIHNIGGGTDLEDRLFDWKIIGHYRMF